MLWVGIDPGPTVSGVLEWCDELRIAAKCCGDMPTRDCLAYLRETEFPDNAAIVVEDMEPRGMPAGKDIVNNCKLVGRIEEILSSRGLRFRLIKRSEVKLAMCGVMRAKDPHVTQACKDAVADICGLKTDAETKGTKAKPGPLYGVSKHAWSALACILAAMRMPEQWHGEAWK